MLQAENSIVQLEINEEKIRVIRTDGSIIYPTMDELTIYGSLFAGNGNLENPRTLEASVTIDNVTKTDEFNVSVNPISPVGIDYVDGPSYELVANTDYIPEIIRVEFNDGSTKDVMDFLDPTYKVIYSSSELGKLSDEQLETADLSDTGMLSVKDEWVKIVYEECGERFISEPIYLLDVQPRTIDSPNFAGLTERYDGTYHSSLMDKFDPKVMQISSTVLTKFDGTSFFVTMGENGGELETSESFYLYAKDAGTYRIVVTLIDQNYEWEVSERVNFVQDDTSSIYFEWTINKGDLGDVILSMDDWTFGGTPSEPSLVGLTEYELRFIEYRYWGTAYDTESSENRTEAEATSAAPTQAGEWHVFAISTSGNYEVDTVASDDFRILQKPLDESDYSFSTEYTGSEIDLGDIVSNDGGLNDLFSGSSNLYKDAGTYPGVLTIIDPNFCWSESSDGNVEWEITTAVNSVTSVSVDEWIYLDEIPEDEESFKQNISIYVSGLAFQTSYVLNLYSDSSFQNKINLNGENQYDAGNTTTLWCFLL